MTPKKPGANYFRGSMPERLEFHSIPEPNSGCVLWIGACNNDHGCVGDNGKIRYAHIIAYELAKGPVPAGKELHHVCKVPFCINPDHLQPVTRSEHQILEPRRRVGDITHCKRGHEFTAENTYMARNGRRNCRACHRLDRFGPRK